MVFDAAAQALEKEGQQYELIELINELRRRVLVTGVEPASEFLDDLH